MQQTSVKRVEDYTWLSEKGDQQGIVQAIEV